MKTELSRMPRALQARLKLSAVGIWYAPFADEPDPARIPLPAPMHDVRFVFSNARDADPIRAAHEAARGRKTAAAYVLIPGRRFDLWGTRHGRGGGWIDRFLHILPPQWLRLGVCLQDQLSGTRLKRESWDEPIDWLLIERDGGWIFHETGARTGHTPHDRGPDTDPQRAVRATSGDA